MIWNIWEFELYGSYPKMEQISPLPWRGVGLGGVLSVLFFCFFFFVLFNPSPQSSPQGEEENKGAMIGNDKNLS